MITGEPFREGVYDFDTCSMTERNSGYIATMLAGRKTAPPRLVVCKWIQACRGAMDHVLSRRASFAQRLCACECIRWPILCACLTRGAGGGIQKSSDARLPNVRRPVYTLHRKLSGAFLSSMKLKAKIECRTMFKEMLPAF